MGGGYYDRDVQVADTPTGHSSTSERILQTSHCLHPDLNPKGKQLVCPSHCCPVICCIDVTGSMGTWLKVILDKMV